MSSGGMSRLWDAFVNGMPIAAIPLRWFRTVTAWLNGMQIVGGRIERTPDGIVIYPNTDGDIPGASVEFSFRTVSNGDNTATMVTGDVRLGPDTLIAWASFTGASTTITADDGATAWYVWLIVDVANETVTWNEGDSVTALTGSDLNTKINVPLVELTCDGETPCVITAVKHLHLGDVLIPRAAG
jgi:hypothetical protein